MKKIKKLLSTILALTLGVAATFGITACGGNDDNGNSGGGIGEHTHNVSCYGYNITHHWLACESSDETKDEERHVDDGAGSCKTYKHLIPTAGVTYSISADGTHAIVTGYDEEETNVVVISPTYDDLPVCEIADSAFADSDRLERITLTDTITTIGANAFSGCDRLMGVMLYAGVTSVGDNAFRGCKDLMIFCEAESPPETWSENWNSSRCWTVWGYQGERMSEVSAKAIPVADGMLGIRYSDRAQLEVNSDLGGVRAPEGFSTVTRYDTVTEGVRVWETSALWHYNYDGTDLAGYSDVWFATKVVNAHWVFANTHLESAWAFAAGDRIWASPWVYVHLRQTGKDYLGYILWEIEVSVGGYVFARIENQSGKAVDKERPINSIARLLWDEGFGSPDGSSILFYSDDYTIGKQFYCTEAVGVRVGT